jgi:DNA-binding beta-propeller fold protein YncE
VKNPLRNARVVVLTAVLLVGATILLLREQRASFLRPGLHLNAYVSAVDGSVAVIDLVRLHTLARVMIGPGVSGMREHPTRPEVWGVSSAGGYAWVLNSANNQVVARIPVGTRPYAVDFSADGARAYVAASGSETLVAIDCQSRVVIGRTRTGHEPVLAKVTPDGTLVLVLNRRDATVEIHDAQTLALRGIVSVVTQPEDVAVIPDTSLAYVLSRSEPRLSVVDLKRRVLLANLRLAGIPSEMLLKPDGGELYVISPEAHGLQAVNTWAHEVGDYVLLGSAPTHAVLSQDASELFVSDTAAGRVAPVDIINRRVGRPISTGQKPELLRFDTQVADRKPNLLLVVNEGSGDLSVIGLRAGSQSLLTMIPVGTEPKELAVKLF